MYLDSYIDQIRDACVNAHVKRLYVFGSVVTPDFKPESDVDFVVDIVSEDPIEYAEQYFVLKFTLEDILKRSVDLLEEKVVRNPYLRKNIDNTKVLVYES